VPAYQAVTYLSERVNADPLGTAGYGQRLGATSLPFVTFAYQGAHFLRRNMD